MKRKKAVRVRGQHTICMRKKDNMEMIHMSGGGEFQRCLNKTHTTFTLFLTLNKAPK